MRRILLIVLAVLAAGFLLIQLIPIGRAYKNPPVVAEPAWDSPQTRELAQRACFDCHSNETVWPWYANVAPASWLVQRDVNEGREHLNFTDWNQSHEEHGHEGHTPEDLVEVLRKGEMPPANYLMLHPDARLTDAEREALIEGLLATAESSPIGGGSHEGDHTANDDHTDDAGHADQEEGHEEDAP